MDSDEIMFFTSNIYAGILLLAILVVILLYTYFLNKNKHFLIFDPLYTFFAGFIIVYVVQPIRYYEEFISWHSNGEWVLIQTLFWGLIGLLCVILGYELGYGKKIISKIPRLPRKLDKLKYFKCSLAFILLGVFGYFLFFNSAGGMKNWLAISRGGTDFNRISSYTSQIPNLLFIGTLLLVIGLNIFEIKHIL